MTKAESRSGAALPVLKWAGGKRNLLGQLLPMVPEIYGTFFEPFLGGGSFFLSLAPACAVLNDANQDLIDLYRWLGSDPEAVMAALDEMQAHVLDPGYYYRLRSCEPASLTPAHRSARLIFLNKTCYNGLYRVNRSGGFNVPFGRYARPPRLYDRENLRRVSELLRRAELRCGDFETAVESAGPGDFVYLDPPYVPLTASASFTSYTAGSFGESEQRRLADLVRDLSGRGCRVLLSNSDMPLVRELYREFRIDVVHAPRHINSDAAGRSRIAELAIRNY